MDFVYGNSVPKSNEFVSLCCLIYFGTFDNYLR